MEFPENTSTNQPIYNSITVPTFFVEESIADNGYYGNFIPRTTLGQPVEIPAGQTQDVFLNLSDFEQIRGSFFTYLDNITLTNSGVSETSTSTIITTINPLQVKCTNLRYLEPASIVLTYRNESTATRWVRSIELYGAFVIYYSSFPNFATNEALIYKYENKESIKKFGKKEYPIGSLRVPASITSDQPATLRTFWKNTIDSFSGLDKFSEIEITINNNPAITLNTRVKLKNKQGIVVRGVVNKVDVNQANKKTITIYIT